MKLPTNEECGIDPFLRMLRVEDAKGYFSPKRGANQSFRVKRRFNFCIELLGTFLKGDKSKIRIADFACGTGNVGLFFHEAGYDVTFVDNESKFFEYIKLKTSNKDIKAVHGSCSSYLSDQKYDAIFFGEAIEHMANPALTLNNLRENLKTGGMLCLTTPNGDYVDCSEPCWNEVKDNKERNEKLANNIGNHVCEFKMNELKELVKLSGFAINYHGVILSKQMSKMSLIRRIFPAVILNKMDEKFSKKKNRDGKMYGQTQIMLAQRIH